MAENTQTFILVGDFKDNITPSLKKLNTQIEALNKSFAKISKQLRPISKEFGIMAGSAERMTQALKGQRGSFDSNVRAMQQYRKEASKVRAANEQMARSQSRALRGVGGGGGGGGGGGAGTAAVAGGFVAGTSLANGITNAIVKGFNIGVGIMKKPFQYGARAIGERLQDEMSDIKSAGGMFSVDRRENLGIFKTFDDAMRYQEDLNARLAKSAAALPGETAEYVAQAKQITDTVMLSYAKNKEGFEKFAQELDPAAKGGLDSMATVLQKFTEKSVLLGQGEGNTMYGVPQILEMLVSQDKVNLGAFRKFGAYMRNPLLKNALESAEAELKATGANTAERFRVVQKVLDQAVPHEVIMKMQASGDGMLQAVKSAFLDPETGLFGLGRKLNIGAERVDSLGRYLDKNNKVVATAAEAAKDSASLFQMMKETLGGFILPMTAILDFLPEIYEPLAGLAEGFLDLRNVSQQFYRNFNAYTKYFEKQANAMSQQAEAMRKAGNIKGADAMAKRAGKVAANAKIGGFLSATNDLLLAFGGINTTEYQQNAKELTNNIENLDSVGMLKRMFSQLLSSDFMQELGDAIGSLIGGILKSVGDLMQGVNSFAETGPFAKGLKKGFEKAKGGQGIALIFKNLFSVIGKVLMTLFKSAPMEMSILSALTMGMPLLQGAITQGMIKLFSMVASGIGMGGAGGIGASIAGWLGAVGPALGFIASKIPQVAAFLAILVGLGGGVENTMRQLSELGGELWNSLGGNLQALGDLFGQLITFTGDLIGGIIELIGALLGLFGNVNFTAESFDLLKAILIPITATFQLVEMGLRGLVEGLSNVRLWLLKMTNWGGRNNEKIKQAEEDLKSNTQKQNESKRRIDVYNTAIRYGGAENYAKVLEKDIAAKKAEMGKAGLLKSEREKLNNELFMLNKTLEEARKQAGKPTPGGQKPGQRPNQPGGAPAGAPPAPAAPPVPAVTPQAITNLTTATNAVKTTTQAVNTSTQAVNTSTQAVNGTTQGVRTAVDAGTTKATEHATQQQTMLDKLMTGINNVKSALISISGKVSTQATVAKIESNTNETNVLLKAINTSIKGISMMPGFGPGGFSPPLGGAQGSLKQAASMASANGLTLTSSFRPGDPGYHGVGRAMDFSNSTGPTPQMMEFAQQMIARYGSSLTELIYSPLGFSIKNGKKVAPLAYGAHFNHVHVAFAHGLENPRFFSSAEAAQAYEGMYAPAGAKVQTVTANTSESLGGHYTVNQNITISGAQDPRALAEAVFNYAAQAAEHINNTSFA
jgi:hypothetical protein